MLLGLGDCVCAFGACAPYSGAGRRRDLRTAVEEIQETIGQEVEHGVLARNSGRCAGSSMVPGGAVSFVSGGRIAVDAFVLRVQSVVVSLADVRVVTGSLGAVVPLADVCWFGVALR